ncbi:hypothetical protein LCGC14_3023480 [marine sediment metagenome]|uniref:Uncharacterized protein n=1 Tax=marine sediment metagenome TaxID=412755 RepID=A0A0F8XHN3_9ZZZZ
MVPLSTGRPRLRLLSVLTAGLTLAAGAGLAEPPKESIVYYQAIYANGRIRDLARVPTTNKGVRRVVRISRVEGIHPGLAVHSVDAYGIGYSQLGRTVRKELHWNGKAWVLPTARKEQPSSRTARAPKPTPTRVQRTIARVAKALEAARKELPVAGRAVVKAAEVLTKADSADAR